MGIEALGEFSGKNLQILEALLIKIARKYINYDQNLCAVFVNLCWNEVVRSSRKAQFK